jgi:hypothetical protein
MATMQYICTVLLHCTYICNQRGEFITENLYLLHKPLKLLKKTLLGDPLKAFMIFFVNSIASYFVICFVYMYMFTITFLVVFFPL